LIPAPGKLTFVQRMTDGVKVPRNYAIDPSGNGWFAET
jgi:6-phosphogluconolactonase (cycloisomerase 2 family)